MGHFPGNSVALRSDLGDLTPMLLAEWIASPLGPELQLLKALQHRDYPRRRLLLLGSFTTLLRGKGALSSLN